MTMSILQKKWFWVLTGLLIANYIFLCWLYGQWDPVKLGWDALVVNARFCRNFFYKVGSVIFKGAYMV